MGLQALVVGGETMDGVIYLSPSGKQKSATKVDSMEVHLNQMQG
jgi:hypothetical protein